MGTARGTYPTLEDYRYALGNPPSLHGGYRRDNEKVYSSQAPLVTIITVTFNAADSLARTIESVRKQTYPNIEHIIVDGGSTDSTLDVIRDHEKALAYWGSEPDQGIYDAFNKGITLARGEFVGILNADDYYEPDQIRRAVSGLISSDAAFIHGDIVLHGWRGSDIELHGDPNYELAIRYKMPSLHQVTSLCRISVFEAHGLFSTRYKIAGDFDWYLRLATRGVIGKYIPGVRAHMTAGGISTTQQRRALTEALLITWRHGLPLIEAMFTTLPKVLFPNGPPPVATRIARAVRNPGTASRKLLRRFRSDRVAHAPLSVETRIPVMAAFLDARQLTSHVDDLGLEWIYGLGLRAWTYSLLATNREGAVAQFLLDASGAKEHIRANDADILIVDNDKFEDPEFEILWDRKTYLVVFGSKRDEDFWRKLPLLDFGQIIGIGQLVNPLINLRAQNQ